MKSTTRLKQLIESPELLVMPGAFDPVSAKLIEQAGFQAVQCSGGAISGTFLGLPDYSFISLTEMVERTRLIAQATTLPVMGDGDTGYGNAVNAYYTVQAFERAGAAGINIEDQVSPKRCGHLDGKTVIPFDEAVVKIRAAADARVDKDFVLNARTDALPTEGIEGAIARGNAYLEAGATMVFIDGISSRELIRAAVKGINGPVAVNLVEGGKSPIDITFAELEQLGVARVSLPGTLYRAAVRGMQRVLERIKEANGVGQSGDLIVSAPIGQALYGAKDIEALELKYLAPLAAAKAN